jgi:hypothetical protein
MFFPKIVVLLSSYSHCIVLTYVFFALCPFPLEALVLLKQQRHSEVATLLHSRLATFLCQMPVVFNYRPYTACPRNFTPRALSAADSFRLVLFAAISERFWSKIGKRSIKIRIPEMK